MSTANEMLLFAINDHATELVFSKDIGAKEVTLLLLINYVVNKLKFCFKSVETFSQLYILRTWQRRINQ